MSCRDELRKVQLAAPPPPEVSPDLKQFDPTFRAGYLHGFHDMAREAIEIVEQEHEEEDA